MSTKDAKFLRSLRRRLNRDDRITLRFFGWGTIVITPAESDRLERIVSREHRSKSSLLNLPRN